MGQENVKSKLSDKSTSDNISDYIFEFEKMAKNFGKESRKAEIAHRNLLGKVKDSIRKGDQDKVKEVAADAIRKKKEIKRYQFLSSKLETLTQRLQREYQTQ